MSKQTSLDKYINKRFKPDDGKKASSKDKYPLTVNLESEEEVTLEVYGISSNGLVCPAYVLITPADSILYEKFMHNQLADIEKDYSKERIMAYLMRNLKFHQVDNLDNLKQIKDDQFWSMTVPIMLQTVRTHIKDLAGRIRLLPTNSDTIVELTRLQILLLMASMFFGIMPKQPHALTSNFGRLMEIKEKETSPVNAAIRREKLTCIINYFKNIVKDVKSHKQIVKFQRRANSIDYKILQQNFPLREVSFRNLRESGIEGYYGKAIMVDFANKKIGGGILTNGCVQEQILFCQFPQVIVSKLLCDEMQDNEAIIIYGAKRVSLSSGYKNDFTFAGTFIDKDHRQRHSVIVAIDAIDFNQNSKQISSQYSKKFVRREIFKALAGFDINDPKYEEMPVCTGKWGSGAFKGDQTLKFLIQWIACSICNRQMTYICSDAKSLTQYRLMAQDLIDLSSGDLLNVLDEYYRQRSRLHRGEPITLENYIKRFV